jgi:hypothetical protein
MTRTRTQDDQTLDEHQHAQSVLAAVSEAFNFDPKFTGRTLVGLAVAIADHNPSVRPAIAAAMLDAVHHLDRDAVAPLLQ